MGRQRVLGRGVRHRRVDPERRPVEDELHAARAADDREVGLAVGDGDLAAPLGRQERHAQAGEVAQRPGVRCPRMLLVNAYSPLSAVVLGACSATFANSWAGVIVGRSGATEGPRDGHPGDRHDDQYEYRDEEESFLRVMTSSFMGCSAQRRCYWGCSSCTSTLLPLPSRWGVSGSAPAARTA